MSSYTISLKRVCEVYGFSTVREWFNSYDMNNILPPEQVSAILESKVFNPELLADLIINHYYFREIAFETPQEFKIRTLNKMYEIMCEKLPYIYTMSLEFNPLSDVNVTESLTRNKTSKNTGVEYQNNSQTFNQQGTSTNSGTSSSTSSQTSSGSGSTLNVSSDTPQGQIQKSEILSGKYASSTSANESESSTSANINDSSNTNSSNNVSNDEQTLENKERNNSSNIEDFEEWTKNKVGSVKSKASLVLEYRKLIKNVYNEIIEELNPLFFGLF